MHILIFGASGFIGQDFMNRYLNCFKKIYIFSRKESFQYDLPHIKNVTTADLDHLNTIDFVLHFAFDHSYQENLKLAESVHTVCYLNRCPLIYLSSFVVRDLLNGDLLQDSRSKLNDPYTLEKLRVKEFLNKLFESSDLEMLEIEPGIVFGRQGSWRDHVVEAFQYKFITLANSGKNKAPFIYVGELSEYIFEMITSGNFNRNRVLISSTHIKTWSEFYYLYGKLMNHKVIIKNANSSRLHPKLLIHLLMSVIIYTKVGKFLFRITPTIKSIFKKISKLEIKKNKISSDKKEGGYKSYGITHLLQSIDFGQYMSSENNDFFLIARHKESQVFEEMKK